MHRAQCFEAASLQWTTSARHSGGDSLTFLPGATDEAQKENENSNKHVWRVNFPIDLKTVQYMTSFNACTVFNKVITVERSLVHTKRPNI